MTDLAKERVTDSFNFQPISCGDFRHQTRLFHKAFQYLMKPSWQLTFSEVFLAAIPLITICFVANTGYDQLVGAGYGISLCSIFGLGFCLVSASVAYEIALEKKDSREAVTIIQRGMFLTLAVMCFPIWAVWLNAGPLFRGLKQEQLYSRLGDEYCFMFLPGLPIFTVVMFLQKYMNLIRANAVLPIVSCNIFGAMLNIGLNALFVLGLNMGVRGAALASVVTYLFMTLHLFLCIVWNKKYRKAWPGLNWGIFYEWEQYFFRLLPYLAWVIAEWCTLDVGIYVIGSLDATNRRLGTQIIICIIIRLLAMIADKFASETSDQIEEAVKAKYYNRAVFILKSSILIIWISSLFCGLLLVALPKYVPLSFTNNRPFGLSMTQTIIVLSPIPFLKGTQALGFKIVGKIKTKFLNVIFVMIGFWIFALPIGVSLVYRRHWAVLGFWTGYTIGLLLQTLMFLVVLKDCMQEWTKKENTNENAPSTPSGFMQNDDDEVDGKYSGNSILLGEPRIHQRFTLVERGMDEQDGPMRPSTPLLICRGFVLLLSCGTLIAGIIFKTVQIGDKQYLHRDS